MYELPVRRTTPFRLPRGRPEPEGASFAGGPPPRLPALLSVLARASRDARADPERSFHGDEPSFRRGSPRPDPVGRGAPADRRGMAQGAPRARASSPAIPRGRGRMRRLDRG